MPQMTSSSYGSGCVTLPNGHQVKRLSSVPANAVLRGVLRAGSNSLSPTSEKEYLLLGFDGLGAGDHIVWDADLTDKFDSLWRDVVLTVAPDDSTRLTIVGHTPSLPADGFTYDQITRAVIRARVDVSDAVVSWPAIEVTSCVDGVEKTDVIPADLRPRAESGRLISKAGRDPRITAAASIIEVTPPPGKCTILEIVGGVRMLYDEPNHAPSGDQLLADIFVYATQAMFFR